jgi:P-type E1-E2 ATPase
VIEAEIPGRGTLRLGQLVLDLNGTIALDGELLPHVAERVAALRGDVEIRIASADTFGRLDAIASELGVTAARLRAGEGEAAQKAAIVRALGADGVVAIGNGANDEAMLREAALGIAVLGREGLAVAALHAADLVVPSIADALDLLLKPRRLRASLRG